MNSAFFKVNAAAMVMTSIVAMHIAHPENPNVADETAVAEIQSRVADRSSELPARSNNENAEAPRTDSTEIDDSASLGPQIDLRSLVDSNVLVLPAALEIYLSTTNDAAIDLGTLDVVVRRGIFRRNITDLIRDHASVLMADRILLALEGETAIPAGQYRVYVSISDTLGRSVRERFDIRIEVS